MLDPNPGPGPGLRRRPAAMLTRRRVLADGGRGLLALAFIGAASTACGAGKPPAPDPLEAELEAARRDSDLAAAAAKAAKPAVVPALNEVAAERARHATALVEELSRAAGKPTPTTTSESPTPTASSAPGPPPSVRDVAEALRKSAESATSLAPTLSGYRAGLMGSIAAACTASFTVGLPTEGKPR
ncbi:MAG: hypothetical protein WCP30_02950 [Mycobacteriaceae bacterium]